MTKVKIFKDHLEMEIDEDMIVDKSFNSEYILHLVDNLDVFDVEVVGLIKVHMIELHIIPEENEADLYKHTIVADHVDDLGIDNRWDNVRTELVRTYKTIKSAKNRAEKLADKYECVLNIHE